MPTKDKNEMQDDSLGSELDDTSLGQKATLDEDLLDPPEEKSFEQEEDDVSLTKTVVDIYEKLGMLGEQIQRVKTDDRVLTEMHHRYRELNEKHHEREVLRPIFLGLIGIADRCEQQAVKYRKIFNRYKSNGNKTAVKFIRFLVEAREADKIEIESLLANYSVQAFKQCEGKFDPESQKCIKRIECDDPEKQALVHERVLPGYCRDGVIIRQEYVSVYVRN